MLLIRFVSDLMLHRHCLRARALLYLNNTISPTPKCYIRLLRPSSVISLNSFSATTSESDQRSFTLSYLINTCGLSPQVAVKASKRFSFDTAQKPDSIIAFFKNHGFSTSQIQSIIAREPELFAYDPTKNFSSKLQFLASKGISASEAVVLVTRSPRFLRVSLEKQIIPAFELVRSLCPSDKKAISSIVACPSYITDARMKPNVNFLLHDVGVNPSGVYRLLSTRPPILCYTSFRRFVQEVKELGFDPSKFNFTVALQAKLTVSKSQWDTKVDVFKAWGYSEDALLNAFKKHPHIMLNSAVKLNAVMSFWIDKLGWDPLSLISAPLLFGYSLEKRLIPRASVVNYLLSKGLIKKGARLYTPFSLTDELFLRRFVNCFQKETSKLLSLYLGGC